MPSQVEELLRGAAENPRIIGLAGGLPSPDSFPRRALAESFARALNRPGAPALQYAWPEGLESLRSRIASRLRARGASVSASDVIVTNGAQQAISMAARLLLRRGSRVRVDAASYPSALTAFRSLGILPATGLPARVAYVMPAVDNPRGIGMDAPARRAAVASFQFLIEDDAYGDLRFAGAPAPPLLASARERVLYVGTFSKTLSPGLRVGYLIVPARFRERALRLKQDEDLQANSLSQTIVDDYLAHNDFDAFVARLRRFYAARSRRLMAAVRKHLPSWRFEVPEGGFGLWLDTDDRVDEARLMADCVRAGVTFDPGSSFRGEPDRGPTRVRLCFSSVPTDAMDEGVRRLATAWRRTTTHRSKRTHP